jgi:hypothetical protein
MNQRACSGADRHELLGALDPVAASHHFARNARGNSSRNSSRSEGRM